VRERTREATVPPALGERADEVPGEAGYCAAEIAAMRTEKVV
jgi:hypothetical protein